MTTLLSVRQREVSDFVNAEHFRYRTHAAAPPNSFSLPARLSLAAPVSPSPLVRRAVATFADFLRACFDLEVDFAAEPGVISFRLRDGGEAGESFSIDVTAGGVTVEATHERGLLQASHYLERLMADAGGPFLPLGRIVRQPALTPRFTEGIFVPGAQTPASPGVFSDNYLGLLSHFGANSLKFYFDLSRMWRSKTLPELNTTDFDEQAKILRSHAQRLAEFGIDLYLNLKAGSLDAGHPVFAAHPEIGGAFEKKVVAETAGRNPRRVLCSSNTNVLQAYREALGEVFAAVPELGGIIAIIGGECFHHCFTRAADSKSGETNCPHCRGRDAHAEVANLVNAVYAGFPSGKRLLAWPYSAFVWSGDDRLQARWIDGVAPGVEVLANFDCFDEDEICGAGVRFFDYNIKLIGPSTVFRAQRDACRARGRAIHARTETNTTADSFFLPYLPLHFRWYERFKAIRKSGAAGYMGQWRFYGMNGSIPEELQYHSTWNPDRTAEELLAAIARRDFGLDSNQAESAVEAWRLLSASWDDFPYSAMTSGERDGYMRGPWYLGPAHPLILTPQSRYQLGNPFFQPRGDLTEMISDEAERAKLGKPRYVEDLWICLPFGIDRYLKFARRCRDRWDEGLQTLQQSLGPTPTRRARQELDICETISIHLHTLVNTVEFLRLRDRVAETPQNPESLDAIWRNLQEIAGREIENASRSLPILERDPRIGFGYTYGEVYDIKMVREKLEQCRSMRDEEIPRLRYFMRFHLWQTGE